MYVCMSGYIGWMVISLYVCYNGKHTGEVSWDCEYHANVINWKHTDASIKKITFKLFVVQ